MRPVTILVGLALLGVLGLGAVVASGYVLSAPVPHAIGRPPPDLAATNVEFPSASGALIHGWLTEGRRGDGVVILMHALRADRRVELKRVRVLSRAGYATLVFDFQSHGESRGERITFGHSEALDAEAAIGFARKRFPRERIGIIAQSLGGAAVLLAPHPLPVDAVVLESVYPDIGHALCDRLDLYLGRAGCLVMPIYLAFMPMVIGVRPSELRPIDHIDTLGAPVFVISGTNDKRTTIAETEDLFRHAREPKQLWEVEGADHEDLFNYAPDEYEKRVMPFLAKYLRKRSASST